MKKTAYLTIDDAPSRDMEQKVKFLLSRKIPAIFFCEGRFMEKRPEPVIFAIRNGFIIGNHAYSHTKFSDLPLEKCLQEIERTDKIIEELYKKAGVKRPAKFFRFPYGDKGGLKHKEVFKPYTGEGLIRKNRIQAFLRKLGYTQPEFRGITYKYYRKAGLLRDVDWHWTYDCMEYNLFRKEHEFGIDSLDKVLKRMDEDVPEGCRGLNFPGSEDIILIHDHTESTHIFGLLIEGLLSKGLQFRLPVIF